MNFLKNSVLVGLFILLPLMLRWIGLKEIGGLLALMATPIADVLADLFPAEFFENLTAPGVVAFFLIVATSLILGLVAKSSWVRRIGRSFEKSVLHKIPMYKMLKIISGALVEADTDGVSPALIKDGKGGGDPCYVIEKHKDGLATVLLPWSPASFAGSIRVVQQSDLDFLSCSLDDFARSLSHIGVGVEECMSNRLPEKHVGRIR
jgi:uncharacterized membrane protein